MKNYLATALLSTWSPLALAHPGHGTLPFGDPWQLLVTAVLTAIAIVIGYQGYRSYRARKRDDD